MARIAATERAPRHFYCSLTHDPSVVLIGLSCANFIAFSLVNSNFFYNSSFCIPFSGNKMVSDIEIANRKRNQPIPTESSDLQPELPKVKKSDNMFEKNGVIDGCSVTT